MQGCNFRKKYLVIDWTEYDIWSRKSRGHHGHMTSYLNTIWENSAIWELANKLGEIQIHVLTSKGSF